MAGSERFAWSGGGPGRSTRGRARLWLGSLAALVLLPAATCSKTEPVSTPPLTIEAVEIEEEVEPDLRPIRMVARNGADMPLVSLDLRGSVEDPLAFTQLTMVFENREPRPLDGTLELKLPPAASITRFAAQIEGEWREAEVVEREDGALQPSLYDPAQSALELDPDGDQRFRVTLPGIPPRSKQRVVLSYTETFARADMAYRVRLEGLESIPSFRARVVAHSQPDPLLNEVYDDSRLSEQLGLEPGRRVYELSRRAWTSNEDFVVPTSGLRRTGVRAGRKIAARINPLTHDHAAPIHSLTLLFDTSASRAVGYEQRVEQLATFVEALQPWTGSKLWLRIIAFDQGFKTVYEGRLGDIERGVFDDLQRRRPLGASNLASVLSHLQTLGDAIDGPPQPGDAEEEDERLGRTGNRVVLIGDGMTTAGVSERARLLKAVEELAAVGVERVDVIADHGRRDERTLDGIVHQLDESGLVLDSLASPRQVVRRLLRTVHDDVKISVPGARWYYPEVVHGVQSDDEILVYADVETLEAGMRVTVESHGKETQIVPLVEVEDALVGRAHAQAVVQFLVDTLETKGQGQSLAVRRDMWRKIIDNSRVNRVVNDYTRLEMLADASDYARERLDPAALPKVLVVGADAIEEKVRGLPPGIEPVEGGEEDEPGARLPYGRVPRFASESLGVEQQLLLVPQVTTSASGLSSADADAVMAAGAQVDTLVEGVPSNPLESFTPPEDSPAVELLRMLRAKPVERPRTRPRPPPLEPENAYRGNMLAIMNLIDWGNLAEAEEVAWRWREAEPAEVMALVALGEALEANEEWETAARAYGSIIDLHPDRADMRRFAGSRLEHLGTVGNRLAIDTYRRARQQRPDHPSSHRLLAFAMLRARQHERAFDVLEAGLRRDWSANFAGAFAGVEKVLREDLGLIAAAWRAAHPELEAQIRQRLADNGARLEDEPSLRFVLTWETGDSDADLHVHDGLGSHAFYDSRGLSSGGALYFDVTNGYGPEVFTILGEPTGYPYNLQVHYYARGPNGFGMGKVQIVEHDGQGGLAFDERPFVIMKDRAAVDLGELGDSLAGRGEPQAFVSARD